VSAAPVQEPAAPEVAHESLDRLLREPAEPGLVQRRPRARDEGVIRGSLLRRAWGLVGIVSAALVMGGFFLVLLQGGWSFHDPTGPGTEIVVAFAIIYLPFLQDIFDTGSLPLWQVALGAPFPFAVWGVDELRRRRDRRTAVVA
jgi:hypothetical protein